MWPFKKNDDRELRGKNHPGPVIGSDGKPMLWKKTSSGDSVLETQTAASLEALRLEQMEREAAQAKLSQTTGQEERQIMSEDKDSQKPTTNFRQRRKDTLGELESFVRSQDTRFMAINREANKLSQTVTGLTSNAARIAASVPELSPEALVNDAPLQLAREHNAVLERRAEGEKELADIAALHSKRLDGGSHMLLSAFDSLDGVINGVQAAKGRIENIVGRGGEGEISYDTEGNMTVSVSGHSSNVGYHEEIYLPFIVCAIAGVEVNSENLQNIAGFSVTYHGTPRPGDLKETVGKTTVISADMLKKLETLFSPDIEESHAARRDLLERNAERMAPQIEGAQKFLKAARHATHLDTHWQVQVDEIARESAQRARK